MKILVSTKKTQGTRKSDFFHGKEGEAVYLAPRCSNRCFCGCYWSLSGITTAKSSTTFLVKETRRTRLSLERECVASYKKFFPKSTLASERKDCARLDVKENTRMASFFKAGTVLEIKGTRFSKRI